MSGNRKSTHRGQSSESYKSNDNRIGSGVNVDRMLASAEAATFSSGDGPADLPDGEGMVVVHGLVWSDDDMMIMNHDDDDHEDSDDDSDSGDSRGPDSDGCDGDDRRENTSTTAGDTPAPSTSFNNSSQLLPPALTDQGLMTLEQELEMLRKWPMWPMSQRMLVHVTENAGPCFEPEPESEESKRENARMFGECEEKENKPVQPGDETLEDGPPKFR